VIRRDGERMILNGPVTLANVVQVLADGAAQIEQGVRTVDLAEVEELDSSALAMLLAWLREAKRRNRPLVFANLPEGLTTIARLYGVAELLPAASTHR
jgi:phospholipid transport system transporter-binding protein